jgi:hypothetical protein
MPLVYDRAEFFAAARTILGGDEDELITMAFRIKGAP